MLDSDGILPAVDLYSWTYDHASIVKESSADEFHVNETGLLKRRIIACAYKIGSQTFSWQGGGLQPNLYVK